MPSDHSTCFQCGLSNPPNDKITYPVLGEERYFCCYGCQSVAQTIVETGNEDYYHFREMPNGSNGPATLPSFLEKLQVYDNPEVQKSFVRSQNNHQEAFLILEDIRCAACVWLNEQHLRKQPGIIDVSMDYATHQARVVWDPKQIELSEILFTIASIGYQAHPFDPVHRERLMAEQKRKSTSKLLLATLLSMEVMAHAIATYWMGGFDAQGHLQVWEKIGRWTDLIVITIMLVFSGNEFYYSAWRDLKNKQLGMDVPVVLGLTTAYIGSLIATINQSEHVYFDSIAMFIFLMLAARYYELQGRLIAGASLDKLLKIVPKTVQRLDGDEVTEVLVNELIAGDKIQLNPGETVPVDGILLSSQSSFDESFLTGEVMPVIRQQGEKVISGSCNVDQPVTIQITSTTMNSTLNDIKTLLGKGIESKPHYALIAERASKWFILAILIIATTTAISWYFIDPSQIIPITVSVLIVTCPCALALATPVALALSSGIFAEMGVLPLKMASIEDLSQSDTIIFDKTGTLTKGHPQIIKTLPQGNLNQSDYLKIAASLEWYSEHPIAKAFKQITSLDNQSTEKPPLIFKNLKNNPGLGIIGELEKNRWSIGKMEFCVDLLEIPSYLKDTLNLARQNGDMIVSLSKNRQLECIFILQDQLREGSDTLVEDLKKTGIKHLIILSGDHPESVKRLAEKMGFTQYHGNMKPQDKLQWIQDLQAKGQHIVMIGDGINDAPTLAAANVSISFTEATDLAQINSDFVIMSQQINSLPKLRQLSKKTRRLILQNLSWAIAYNSLAVPFAALGYIPPWGAALGMSLSSFIVITNSLRLKRFKKI